MAEELENLTEQSSWGGKREGAGRVKGSENEATKEKKLKEKHLHERILKSVDDLFEAQKSLATGIQFLYRIDKDEKGKEGKVILVTDREEIGSFLDGDFNSDNSKYYFIATKAPDNKAIDSMIDRVFGKAKTTTEISGPEGEALPVLVKFIDENNRNTEGV